ncbi:DUF922 domain-containing protein [Pseudomonas luteola]
MSARGRPPRLTIAEASSILLCLVINRPQKGLEPEGQLTPGIFCLHPLSNADGNCSLAGYNLTLDVTMTIPELRTAGLSEGELALWRDYANGIASHEQVHAKDAMNAAVGWLEQIATLGAFTNCQGLTDAFNGIQAQSLEALRQRSAYVDAHSLGLPSELLQQTTLDTVISSRPE